LVMQRQRLFSELLVIAGNGIWSTEVLTARNDTIMGLEEDLTYKSPIKKRDKPNPTRNVMSQNTLKVNHSYIY